jgi:2-amino-4-hydroxy-6-hydroxymethyldihydropteridine diphosphokinase
MPEVVVSIGSNLNRSDNISQGLDLLEQQFGSLLLSPVYESASSSGSKNYYNLVACFSTGVTYEKLIAALKDIEQQCGRDRQGKQRHEKEREEEREEEKIALDLDLLLYGKEVSEKLPHSDILEKAYVLRPLSELLPEKTHPLNQNKFQQLWECFEGERDLSPVDFVWRSQLISSAPVSMPL